ncbi:MAG: ATP-binding protein [Methanococcaceae archaeon]
MKGRHFWDNAIGKAVKKDGKIVAVQGIFQDITERRIVQQKILEQKAELENLLLERDKLFSIIAHDLRSPFMGFISLTELLADEGSQVAAAMNDSAKKILHLLDELLEWSLLLRKGKEAVPGKINLRNQSEISRQLYIKNLSGKSIRFENRIPDELFVFAESKVLDIILRNLFSNAIKFTGPNGLIVLDARLEGSMVTVSVSDSGIGIPSDIAGELFSFSAKTKRDGTEGEKSMGLGLMLCKDYVEKIGGRIWFESKENVGTSFYFTVPAPEK